MHSYYAAGPSSGELQRLLRAFVDNGVYAG
jgi:hypothetical protein